METKKYCWVQGNTVDYVKEMIENGDAFFFQFNGKDYFVAWYKGAYQIQDPRIDDNGLSQVNLAYIDYPGHNEAKSPEELMSLRFLDGKTIFERFEELKFFD